jgi:hypothetical protein
MFYRLSLLTLGLTGLLICAGCEGKTSPKPKDAKPAQPAQTVITSESKDGLAELSAEDRKLAEKQKNCPVTGEPLGSMGKPVKITVKDRTVFLCCEGCRESIEKDPDKYLAILDGKDKKAEEKK